MSTQKIVLSALAGLAAGAVLGILFAPEKGSETRKKIATKSGGLLDELKDKYNNTLDSLASKLDGVHSETQDLYTEGREIADQVSTTIQRS